MTKTLTNNSFTKQRRYAALLRQQRYGNKIIFDNKLMLNKNEIRVIPNYHNCILFSVLYNTILTNPTNREYVKETPQ